MTICACGCCGGQPEMYLAQPRNEKNYLYPAEIDGEYELDFSPDVESELVKTVRLIQGGPRWKKKKKSS